MGLRCGSGLNLDRRLDPVAAMVAFEVGREHGFFFLPAGQIQKWVVVSSVKSRTAAASRSGRPPRLLAAGSQVVTSNVDKH